jgi:hypothetical protein
MRGFRSIALSAMCVLLAGLQPAAAQAAQTPAGPRLDAPLIVVAAPDANPWVRLLRASGAAARIGTLGEALSRSAGVVTGAIRLSVDQQRKVRDAVTKGARVVTPNDALLGALGIGRTPEKTLSTTRMAGVDGDATWAKPLAVRPLEGGALASVATSGDSVVAGIASMGRGQVLALAVDPLGGGRDGHELLPVLGRFVAAFSGAPAGPTRIGADIYLDPGSLHNGVSGSPADLARRLAGARAVHVAGWNADHADPKFDYPYQALIDALHSRGILVYAWLEPPFVSERFWNEHPECREKTATGRDALVDWRRLIALEDPNCFRLAMPVYNRVVSGFPFDGVDVAELYFEPEISRNNYTPFHPSAVAQFGKDPNSDHAGYRVFRTKLVTELNRRVLQVLNGLPGAKQLDFKMTVIDNKLDPGFGDQVGSDIDALAQVARETGATLQVEDPFVLWTQGPLRYDALVPQLKSLMPPGFVYPDVNVVPRESGYPTATMTGAEFDLAASSAAQASGHVALYSAGTIAAVDMAQLPAALGGGAFVFDGGVQSPWTVQASAAGGSAYKRLKVDGRQWPAGPGIAVIPGGTHQLKWSKGSAAGPGLLRFTGELATASMTGDSMTLRYDSRAVVYAVVDRKPTSTQSVPSPDGGYSVRLPPGRHTATISFVAAGGKHTDSGRGLLVGVIALLAAVAGIWAFSRRRHA